MQRLLPFMRVNYDSIAPNYHARYASGSALPSIANLLHSIAHDLNAQKILEVGCGSGRWLDELQTITPHIYGLDFSLGMLSQARQRNNTVPLTRGTAKQLPFESSLFDLVFCINALHHFDQPQNFIAESYRALRRGGALIAINIDPHNIGTWCVYDYFKGTRETDLKRFPKIEGLKEWMRETGFKKIETRIADHVSSHKIGRDVLSDHFLQKHGTSQLALLSDKAYAEGISKIEAAIAAAESRNEEIVFAAEFSFPAVIGYK
ncbi:MAG: class I SAM-dependent methyltransferase [Chloroflexota bacterium]